jgi:hypothetical protein
VLSAGLRGPPVAIASEKEGVLTVGSFGGIGLGLSMSGPAIASALGNWELAATVAASGVGKYCVAPAAPAGMFGLVVASSI